MASLLSAKENALLSEWRDRPLHREQPFIQDGVVDPSRWESANPKIMLLLKEAYTDKEDENGWDLRERLREDPAWAEKQKAYLVAGDWCYAAHSGRGAFRPCPMDSVDWKKEVWPCLSSSAIVNIKKSGGHPASESKDLQKYATEDADLLQRQIELINPDVVICGYVWQYVDKILSFDEPVYDLVFPSESRYYVDFWHPTTRAHRKLTYYALGCLLRSSGASPINDCNCRQLE
jgi:hypothetical protein